MKPIPYDEAAELMRSGQTEGPPLWRCTCICHTAGTAARVHGIPCCQRCPLCGLRVVWGMQKEHAKGCAGRRPHG